MEYDDEESVKPCLETLPLFQLINRATNKAYLKALKVIDGMSQDELRVKSEKSGNTFLHQIVLNCVDLYRKNNCDVSPAIPVVYRLVLLGCDVNAQNVVGNTCLHMACFRPRAGFLAHHFIRLGADSGLINEAGCRVLHHNLEHKCWMVRGQKSAKCSLWMAVQKEDTEQIDMYMHSWCRVMTRRRRKTLLEVAYDTGNFRIVERLLKYRTTNELVVASLACHLAQVKQLVALKSDPYPTIKDKCNLGTLDCSAKIPKPLIAELKSLGSVADDVIQVLRRHGATDDTDYAAAVEASKQEFSSCNFYQLVEEMTESSLNSAWEEVHHKKFDLDATRESDGAGFMHYLVEKYHSCDNVHLKRQLVRLLYKLTIDGILVNKRNHKGETVLVTAFTNPPDRILLDHLIQMGVDSSIRSRTGLCVCINTYATRGDLVLQPQLNRHLMPGLWVAVEDGDAERVDRWLQSNLCRVNTCKSGRTLIQVAKDMEHEEVTNLLALNLHQTEFATAAMAADIDKMKHCLSMGNGVRKVNAQYSNYFAGFTKDRKAEYVIRPLIISTMEYCPATVTRYMIQFGARLDLQYEECAPCSPLAFWAFRDDIQGDVSLVIAHTADLSLRDELGYTLLHRAVLKKDRPEVKAEVVQVMLDRGANVAARNMKGETARDLCARKDVIGGKQLRQLIDDHVLNLCYIGEYDAVELLIIEGYDHIVDIVDSGRNKTAKELAYMRYYKELVELLDEIDEYQSQIISLHKAVRHNDTKGFVRLVGEKRLAWGIDERGHNILHIAVLCQCSEMISAICEQFSSLIVMGDNVGRTPVHYAIALRDQRATLSAISTSYNVDLSVKDANNLSILDYIEQVERPIPVKLKTRGRRTFNYQPRNLIEIEFAALPKEEEENEEGVEKEN